MPMLAPPVQGYTGLTQQLRLTLEALAGEQLLMPQTVGASTMSLTTQPNTLSPTTGMHLHFFVIGNLTAGSIGIVGTNASGGAQTSITYHVPIAPQNGQVATEFTTKEAWGTITASSITLTTLTPCQVIIFGSYAGKYLIPVTSDAEEKFPKFSPADKRGILFKNFRVVPLTKSVDLTKFDCSTYPDSLWAPYLLIGNNPSITTVPASPPILMASTAKATPMTLTSAPTAPGMFLIFAIGVTNALAGTIVLAGVDNYGNAVSETIIVPASGSINVYSTKRYSSLTSSQFTTTGMTTGATITVTGAYAWTYTWTMDGVNNYTPYTASLEVFDGVMGVVLPGTVLTDGQWSWAKEKEIGFTGKGVCQDYCIVGDNSPTSAANYLSGINPFGAIAQPTTLPLVSWPASFYLDAMPGTPFTAQDGSLLDFKVGITTGRKYYYTGDGFQRASFATVEAEPDFTVDATMIFQNYQYYQQYHKTSNKFALGATFQGNFLGNVGGVTYYENIQYTLPVKIDTMKVDYAKSPVQATIKVISEYDFVSLGFAYRMSVTTATPPTYTA